MPPNPLELGTALLNAALDIDPGQSPGAPSRFMFALRDWANVVTGLLVPEPEKEPPLAGMTYVLDVFWAEVSTSGFEFWVEESREARHIEMAQDCCRRIGAEQAHQAVTEVRQLFPMGMPTTEEDVARTRETTIDALVDISIAAGETVNAEIPLRLSQYMRVHRDQAIAELHLAKADARFLEALAAKLKGKTS